MINLLFAGNYKMYDGILLCLLSMSKYTKEPLNVYVMTADMTETNPEYRPLTAESCATLEKVLKGKNPANQFHRVEMGHEFNDWVASIEHDAYDRFHYTPFALLRLFLEKIPNLPDKLLYLDTDMMINGNIAELFNEDLTGYEMGVVLDRYGKFFINRHYFNSGMLLMNLPKMRETNLLEKTKEMCRTKKLYLSDQSALNRCSVSVKYLPRKFNEQGDLRADTVVQHFSKRFTVFPYFHFSNVKPWQVEQVHKIRKNHAYDDIYEEYLKIKNQK
ncbi:MAG: hypothetical protein J5598_02435 [Clostridia bacterium]|nr:hypothetical protein [Clostridia bacterium]